MRFLIAYFKFFPTSVLLAVACWGLSIFGNGFHDGNFGKDILGIAIAVGAGWLIWWLWHSPREPATAQLYPKPEPPPRPNRQIAELD